MPLCGYPGMLDILSQTRKLECSVMRSHQISLTRRRSTTITTWDAGPLVGMQEERTRRPQSQLEPVLGRVISLSEMASPVYVRHREGLPTPSQAEGDQRSMILINKKHNNTFMEGKSWHGGAQFFPHTQGGGSGGHLLVTGNESHKWEWSRHGLEIIVGRKWEFFNTISPVCFYHVQSLTRARLSRKYSLDVFRNLQ